MAIKIHDGLYYSLSEDTKTAKLEYNDWFYHLSDVENICLYVPATIEDNKTVYTITELGPFAFSTKWVTEIVLPETVMDIHTDTFVGCPTLNTLTIPQSLEHFWSRISKNPNIKRIVCYSANRKIGDCVFRRN
jgi:hypothetical protein